MPASQFEGLRDVIAATLEIDRRLVTPSTVQEDLEEWDSLGHINLMMALEESFGLTLEVDDMLELTSVEAILDFVDHAGDR